MEEKIETTIVYWGYIGIMEKKMETLGGTTKVMLQIGLRCP